MNNAGEGWIRGRGGMDGLTRINKRKEEIGFTLSPEYICADNQMNMVKDKFHAHSMKTQLFIRFILIIFRCKYFILKRLRCNFALQAGEMDHNYADCYRLTICWWGMYESGNAV